MWEISFHVTPINKPALIERLQLAGALSITERSKECILSALIDTRPRLSDWPDSTDLREICTDDWELLDQTHISHLTIQRLTTVFGTDHPTTSITLELLSRLDFTTSDSIQALDVGTGTGVLSLFLLDKGVHTVDSIDCDPKAILLATRNAQLNNLSSTGFFISDITTFSPEDPYSLVVANIPTDLHDTLWKRIPVILSKSGQLVLSGFQKINQNVVLDVYLKHGFRVMESIIKHDWVGVLLSWEDLD